MSAKVEKIEKNVVQLEIEVSAEKFEEGLQKSFQKNASKFNIPGFRRGKAPRKMVERYYGEQTLYEDAINEICPDAFDAAVLENELSPVERPEIDIKQIGEGKPLIFTAKVTVKPEVELGNYKGVEVKNVKAKVSAEDLKAELDKVIEKNARLITVEDRGIKKGDIAIIDFEGFIDGVAFEGGKAEKHNLEIGSGQFIPGFEEQLTGAKTNEELEVNVTFPEDYQGSDLAGKPAVFKVKINEIKFKELPVVDDEFAKDVSEFDTLEAYKADMKEKMLKEATHKAEHETEDAVINKVVENARVEIPQVMIEKHTDGIIYDFEMRLKYQGLDINKYLEIMGMDAEAFRGQFKERAENEVKTQLVVEKIKQVENIEATEEEINEEIKKFAENYKQSEEDFKKGLRKEDMDYIKENVEIKKTVDFIVKSAKLV
jgi:trigger factor